MSGTKNGGKMAAKTNKSRHGSDFYARIGAKGGKMSNTGGFAANRELARKAGAVGGRISRRRKAVKPVATVLSASKTTTSSNDDFRVAA